MLGSFAALALKTESKGRGLFDPSERKGINYERERNDLP